MPNLATRIEGTGFVHLKKTWTKPELRALRISETYDPADGLTREQWEAARELQRRTAEERATEGSDH